MFFTVAQWSAIFNSCLVGIFVVLVSLPLALCVGYVLARRQFPGKWLVEILVNLSLVMPPVVTGYLLLQIFKSGSPLGWFLSQFFGIKIAFEFPGLVVAAAVMSFPLMIRSIRLGFQAVDPRLEKMARTLGVGWFTTFLRISLPLGRNGVIAGCVVAFARSLGEFGATVMLVSQRESTRTIPLLIYTLKDRSDSFLEISHLVVISLFLATGALAISEYIGRKGMRREFS